MKTLLDDQRKAAAIVTEVLLELKALTKPEVSLDMLDEIAERMILERGGKPYSKGYHPSWAPEPYPATLCTSVDFEVCHAPPGGRFLKEGQIVKYDLGVKYGEGCGDAALTVAVGEISNRQERTMRYALRALYAGIGAVKAGAPISAIGEAISHFCLVHGYKVIVEYGGHHIGKEMHEDPTIPHKRYPEDDTQFLQEGAVICIEPMITPGKAQVRVWKDGWTAYVTDRQPVAMYEHMLLVKKDGYEILTHHLDAPDVVQ